MPSLCAVFLFSIYTTISVAQDSSFSPCPLLGPRFPIPKTTAYSPIVQNGTRSLTNMLDAYLSSADGEFGPITPTTTSFSIVLFSTDELNSTKPYFYEYHHTALTLKQSSQGVKEVNGDSVYRLGDLTQIFTAYLFLIETGEGHWDEPVSKWVPALASDGPFTISRAQWHDITLGDLAAHLGGIGKYTPSSELDPKATALLSGFNSNVTLSPCITGGSACDREEFLSYFGRRAPVVEPASTPILSNAGYMILAYALEAIKSKPFVELLNDAIVKPLNLSSTSLLQAPSSNLGVIPSDSASTHWDDATAIEAPFNGLYSSISDVATVLRSILASDLLAPQVTRRWLKPVAHTSNRANSIGRPWEIYSLTVDGPSPIIPIYQARGNIGLYSSHVALVPDYNVGFAILAADSEANADLNAYADLLAVTLIPALEKNAIAQANRVFAGTYTYTGVNGSTATLTIAPSRDSKPGLALTHFTSSRHGDIRALYAQLNEIAPENNLSVRIYPTGLNDQSTRGERVVFRAVFQDMAALADAGTLTCDMWRYVDGWQIYGVGIDEFVFEVGNEEEAISVEVRGLGLKLQKG
jgi:CubicO group peptidase (beta-lactamase class C family)